MSDAQTIRLLRSALVNGERFALVAGDILQFLPDVDDTGYLSIGNATYAMDFKWFGSASSKYVLFDVGNSRLTLEDIDLHLGDNDSVTFGDGSDQVLKWNGTYLECGPATGMWAGAPSPADPRYVAIAHELSDDFDGPALDDASSKWLEMDDAGTGTNAMADVAGGVCNIVTAAADNDYHGIRSMGQSFLFLATKKLWFEARFKLTEQTVNESAWWFGLTDTVTTGGFQANAAGPLASYDGALISKIEGTMAVDFETSNAGDQVTSAADGGTFVSGTWTTVGFYFDGTATTSVITPYYNVAGGTALTAGTAHNITLAGLAEMHLVAGVKACVQLR
ncbi:MAG: hypothetical protein ACYSWO_29930 [Planctomycetota bacterium]|jgi:hypothetical protein